MSEVWFNENSRNASVRRKRLRLSCTIDLSEASPSEYNLRPRDHTKSRHYETDCQSTLCEESDLSSSSTVLTSDSNCDEWLYQSQSESNPSDHTSLLHNLNLPSAASQTSLQNTPTSTFDLESLQPPIVMNLDSSPDIASSNRRSQKRRHQKRRQHFTSSVTRKAKKFYAASQNRKNSRKPVEKLHIMKALSELLSPSTVFLTDNISDSKQAAIKGSSSMHRHLSASSLFYCSICFNDTLIAQQQLGYLPVCQHIFCFKCIRQWSKITNCCPLCKMRFHLVEHYRLTKTLDTVKNDPLKNLQIPDRDTLNNTDASHQCALCSDGIRSDEMKRCRNCSNVYHAICYGDSQYCEFCSCA